MNARTCFDILHIPLDASLDDARESYKRLVKLWHPDQYGNFPEKQIIAQEKLKEINVAYRDLVTILKRNSVVIETSTSVESTQRQPEENTPSPKKKEPSFWNRFALFIKANIISPNRSEDQEVRDPLPPGATQREGAASEWGKSGTAPDFQQVLKRAIHNKRLRGVARKRQGGSQRGRRKYRGTHSYQVETNTKRSPGDRVEKITPVGRVNRIGGD